MGRSFPAGPVPLPCTTIAEPMTLGPHRSEPASSPPYLFSASPTDREAGGARGKFSGEISAPAKSGAVAWATQDRVFFNRPQNSWAALGLPKSCAPS